MLGAIEKLGTRILFYDSDLDDPFASEYARKPYFSVLDASPVSDDETIGEVMVRILKPWNRSLYVCESYIAVVPTFESEFNMIRIYPSPVVDTDQLTKVIAETIEAEWIENGGEDAILVLDTDHQSLLVISTKYDVHLEVERLLERMNRATGIGWRKNVLHWNRLVVTACENALRWLTPKSEVQSNATSIASSRLTPATRGGGQVAMEGDVDEIERIVEP